MSFPRGILRQPCTGNGLPMLHPSTGNGFHEHRQWATDHRQPVAAYQNTNHSIETTTPFPLTSPLRCEVRARRSSMKEISMTITTPPDGRLDGPARYRVKRAEVEALQWTGSNITEMTAFAGSEFSYYPDAERGEEAGVLTSRHSSWETLIPGQWVLRGPHGLFVVGSQQFAEDYEPITEGASS